MSTLANLPNVISETVRAAVSEAVARRGGIVGADPTDDSNDVTVVVVNVIPIVSGQIRIEREVEL